MVHNKQLIALKTPLTKKLQGTYKPVINLSTVYVALRGFNIGSTGVFETIENIVNLADAWHNWHHS